MVIDARISSLSRHFSRLISSLHAAAKCPVATDRLWLFSVIGSSHVGPYSGLWFGQKTDTSQGLSVISMSQQSGYLHLTSFCHRVIACRALVTQHPSEILIINCRPSLRSRSSEAQSDTLQKIEYK
jgi:hypothetical protein